MQGWEGGLPNPSTWFLTCLTCSSTGGGGDQPEGPGRHLYFMGND